MTKIKSDAPMKRRAPHQRWLVALILGLAAGWLLYRLRRHKPDNRTRQYRFWETFYDRYAALYDAVDWLTGNTTHRLRRRVLKFLPSPGTRVLEIGCGSGKLHVELAATYTLAGLDLAQGMINLTQRRLDAQGLTSDLRQGDAAALPWLDSSFDAVFSTFAFSALADQERALDEMVRVLKPGGRLIIADGGPALDNNRIAAFFARLWESLGPTMRDERPLLEARGLITFREDYGPWHTVHVTVGLKPPFSV